MPTASATRPSVVCSYPVLTNSRVEASMIPARVSSRRRARELEFAAAPGYHRTASNPAHSSRDSAESG
jgi:hypothetical protein